jgi:hypothetical protein
MNNFNLNMDNFILIIIFLIIIFFIINNRKNEKITDIKFFDNDANYQYIQDINKPCMDYNCKIDSTSNDILLVGSDKDNNQYFKLNNDMYKLNNNNLIKLANANLKDINFYEYSTKVPFDLNNMKIKIKLFFNGFQFVGILTNKFYNQEYLTYEKQYDKDNELENKLFEYILIKIINNQYKIMYELPPREKITPNQSIWVSYGSFQIGPLLFI